MAKRYHRRRRRRNRSSEFFLTLGVAVVVALGYLYYSQLGTVEIATRGITTTLIIAGVVMLPVLIGVLAVRRYRARRKAERRFLELHFVSQFVQMDPFEFERFVGWIFEKRGYTVEVTQERADHGLDLKLSKDGHRYVAQVKRYRSDHRVGEQELRDFYGSFVDDKSVARGIFITTSDFTAPAREWAKGRPLNLVTGGELVAIVRTFEGSSWQALMVSGVFK